MARKNEQRKTSESIKLINNYYTRSGLYKFLLHNALKVIGILIVVIIIFGIIEKYIIDLDYLFSTVLKSQKPGIIFILFGISESLLGLIPPDFFILWSKQFAHPFNAITLLAIISYTGGVISYKIGRYLSRIPRIKIYIEEKQKKNIRLLRRWGGVFVVVAALFPLPYSAVSMAVGIIKYPISSFMLLGLSRLVRFYLYAIILFGLI